MAAAAAAGGAMQIVGNTMSANSRAEALESEADAADQNAKTAVEQSQYNAKIQQIRADKKIGAAQAGYGASGVDIHEGSAAEVLMSSTANAERDRLEILHGGQIKALMMKAQAGADRQAAWSTRQGAMFGAAGTAVSTGASIYGRGTSANAGSEQMGED